MSEVLLDTSNQIDDAKYTVYIHKNKINDKVYVGQTSTPVNQRWQDGKGYKGCTLFERAINKYGWDNFEHIIVADNLTKDASSKMEKELIALYDSRNPQNGYNISIGGDSGHAGVPLSDETRRKISEAQRGKVVSQETRNKMSLALKGRSPSALALQKANEIHNIEVVQLTLSGEYVACYCSSAEASRQTGVNESTINACCNNRKNNKSAGGFLWMKKVDYNSIDTSDLCYQNDHLKPVVQLTKSGQYVAEFCSCKEAQIAIGKMSANCINRCCRGDIRSAYGFIWIYKDEYDTSKNYAYKRGSYANQYAVTQLDQSGNVIAEFNSVKMANAVTGINYCSICECCNGTQKTAGGFMWKRSVEMQQDLQYKINESGGESDD